MRVINSQFHGGNMKFSGLLIFVYVVMLFSNLSYAESTRSIVSNAVRSAAAREGLGYIEINFDINRRNLHGKASLYKSGRRAISFHRCLANANTTNNEQYLFVRDIALHEVAHHVVWRDGGRSGSHGSDFKRALRNLGVRNEKKSLSGDGIRGCPIR